MLPVAAYSLVLAVMGTTGVGPCDLVDRAAATQLLGVPPASVTPSGPEPDEDTGGTRTTCVYMAGQRMLVVIRVAYASAAAAREATTQEMQAEKLAEDDATAKEVSGPGDKAFLVHTKYGVQYVVLKGSSVISLALGGMPNPLPTYEAQLRTAAGAAATKL